MKNKIQNLVRKVDLLLSRWRVQISPHDNLNIPQRSLLLNFVEI